MKAFGARARTKAKDVPLHAMESLLGRGDIAPLILDLDTR
jgi:hypothetical protein